LQEGRANRQGMRRPLIARACEMLESLERREFDPAQVA